MNPPPRSKLVAVHWEDAAFDLDKRPEVHDVITVGWVVWRNQYEICVASERLEAKSGEGGEWFRGHTTVPMRSVTSIEEIS